MEDHQEKSNLNNYRQNKIGKRLLSIPETAEYISRTQGAVQELIYKGIIPVVKWDRRIFIDIHDLDALIDQSKKKKN